MHNCDFISWFTTDFVSRPQSSEALTAGVRTAILGSLWTILFTILLAFPLGVGAAIYLEEYATDNWLNRTDPNQYQQSCGGSIHCVWDSRISHLRADS